MMHARAGIRGHALAATCLGAALAPIAAGCGARTAPDASAVPLIPAARVLAVREGGSSVDTGSDRNRYRYLLVAGRRNAPLGAFVSSEVRLLILRHWVHLTSTQVVRKGYDYIDRSAGVESLGAVITLTAPSGQIRVGMTGLYDLPFARSTLSATPLNADRALVRLAIERHEPVLSLQLSNASN